MNDIERHVPFLSRWRDRVRVECSCGWHVLLRGSVEAASGDWGRHIAAGLIKPRMRYTYLGDCLTDTALVGMQCDPVRREDGKCVVSIQMATALVEDAQGTRYVVLRRRLRVNRQKGEEGDAERSD